MAKKKPSTIRTMFDIVYKDSMNAINIDDLIRKLCCDEYCVILHDRDILPNGEFKKPHYHIYAKWFDPQRHDSVLKLLGLNSQHIIETARNKKNCIRYMLHITTDCVNANKVIYDKSNFITNIENIDDIISNVSDFKKMSFEEVFNAIDRRLSGELTYQLFIQYLLDNDLLDTYSKYYYSVFKDYKGY